MKRYVTLIAGLTLASASFVYAAEDGTMKSTDKTATDQNSSMNTLNSMNPDELEGVDIYNSDGEKIGDVDEIVKGKNGQRMAVIGLDGDTKEVAVPLSKLSMNSDGDKLMIEMTNKQLMALPDYDPMDMESVDE
ncbi:PRC-barrel domain-containing protein [Marinobacter sp. M3C]|uniref:PRC-barrel domain-containing protein n=1 Tax=unclassified Marinobacter TaxID=83889 RepID=UPI00200BCCED|nr:MULTISPECIES: PRC-barrel domain-containing protein [unclassified Marinobacter]MCL1483270.1 PRC-barrel domain-containing protein [Marinobacter sp.]MCL1487136.1 PRC-barrel domain-containing protein [Marinobacter sp.]UQG54808.1 PRC-barrel domain-containing protein [Marinobacter sp. M4C]UQG59820.1 PRC-barrel domain-containing protein [Marinobacter sp. M3C]UQG63610.1 PRC-barrel domain-containing protein [Marinobacter sp. M2C]